MPFVKTMLLYAIWLMMLSIFVSIVISWLRQFGVRVPYGNPLVQAIESTADLMLRPIRRSVPTAAGGFDFSPVVAILILYILEAVVRRL